MQLDIWKPGDTDTLLERAAKRKGIRAANLMAAISSIEEMNRQRPQFSKPSVLIESAEVVLDNRASAKDMALYEALLAIAKDGGMENSHHSIKADILMNFLQTDSVERLIDALIRVASTMVKYDVRDMMKRKRYTGAVPLIGFEVESDLPKEMKKQLKGLIDRSSSILHFKIPPVIREVFLQPKTYTYVNLYSISQFEYKYTNAIYQLLAVKAGYDHGYNTKPLTIDAQELAIKIGWSHARSKPFNAALFLKRCVEPALQDIRICVREFDVEMKPLERDKKKRGSPLKPLVFEVRRKHNFELSGVDLLARKKLRTKEAIQMDVAMPDHIHPPEYLPSLAAVTRAAQVLRKPNFYDRSDIAKENRNRPRQLTLHWRTMLDAITADPDRMVSHHLSGYDIFAALDDPRVGVDMIFEQWAINTPRGIHRMGVPARHHIHPPSAKNRPIPGDGVLRHSIYGLVANIERLVTDLSSPYVSKLSVSYSNLAESLVATPGVWEAIRAAAALQGVNLGGLTKAMGMMSKAHPVRMRWTAKNVCQAVFDHDWRKIEKTMKAIFAQKDKLDRSPINGKLMPRRQDVDAPVRARRDEETGEVIPNFH